MTQKYEGDLKIEDNTQKEGNPENEDESKR